MPQELILFVNREHAISMEALTWAERVAEEKGLALMVYDENDFENDNAKELIFKYKIRDTPTFIYKGKCYQGFVKIRIE